MMPVMNMSIRQEVAQNIADTCVFGQLNESYGVSCERATDQKGKSHWSILFAKARTLDGVVRVYSPSFILISWQGAAASAAGLPFQGRQVCKSEADAKAFIVKNFVSK
jgi:hypothetical protein